MKEVEKEQDNNRNSLGQGNILKNIIFSFGGQFIVLILGIVVPRIMITGYGSDINGLVSTITQVFSYMALLEAGIGQAAKNALYKPIAEKDRGSISYVVSIARRYFRSITKYYFLLVVVCAFLLPLVINTEVNYGTVFWVVFFEGMSGAVTFYFIQINTVILNADGKNYIISSIDLVNKVLGYLIKIFLARKGVNIAILQIAYFLITICKVVVYRNYFKKYYSWINYDAAPNREKLKDRNSYVVSELAWTIFSSTDLIVLSIFMNTKLSSVYSIYNMVFSAINMLIVVVYNSLNYKLGQTYHQNIESYKKLHDGYCAVFFGGMTALMCVAYVLIIPFVTLYTKGVYDVEYVNTSLPIMFCLIQILSWSRYVTGNLVGLAGYASKLVIINITEACINIILSILLVQSFGVVGVLVATVAALPLKVIFCAYISDHIVLKRSYWNYLKLFVGNISMFLMVVLGFSNSNININNYYEFLIYGVGFTLLFLLVFAVLNSILIPEIARMGLNMLRRLMKK